MKRITTREMRRSLASKALPEVRKLVAKFDLPSVNNAVKMIYAERVAANELKKAEQKVQELQRKLGVK